MPIPISASRRSRIAAAIAAAVLRLVARGDQIEFLNRFERRRDVDVRVQRLVVDDAVAPAGVTPNRRISPSVAKRAGNGTPV